MNLRTLIDVLERKEVYGKQDIKIKNISYDSRKVKPNTLFVCIKGFKFNGHNFVKEALHKGAGAIVGEEDSFPENVPVTKIIVPNSRKALANLAAKFYNFPSTKLKLIGITGTNGKTTTAYLTESILKAKGYKVSLLGTIIYKIGDKIVSPENTTPQSLDLQRFLNEIKKKNNDYVVMEVSSHALALYRTESCEFQAAIFTNLNQDHLDFHHTLPNYLKAKSELFTSLKKEHTAIINLDDPVSEYIMKETSAEIITYGIVRKAMVRAENIKHTNKGISFKVLTPQGNLEINLNLKGTFNVYNALGALSCALNQGVSLETAKKGLEDLEYVPGRFEQIKQGQKFTVIIDYAHTPGALEEILKEAQGFTRGKIITLFGCGGDRDKGKRPLMGKIADKYSDYIILTSDNPRNEEPMEIIQEIKGGVSKRRLLNSSYKVIIDRFPAIKNALAQAGEGDTVIIAGKGHETYQIIKDKIIPFNDREVIEEILGS